MNIDRRQLLRLSVWGGGGLLLGFSTEDALLAGSLPSERQVILQPNAWIRIEAGGQIVFTLDKAEMGQGVYASLPLLVAEELEIEPEQMVIEFAPASREYGNAQILGIQVTGGSSSMAVSFEHLRYVGASLRELLRVAAAKRWQVDVAQCEARDGMIHRLGSQEKLRYADLAIEAAKLSIPAHVPLKKPEAYRLLGKARLRGDAAIKVTGQAEFGIDVKIPELRCAVFLRSPVLGGRLKSFDATEAKKLSGVEDIVAVNEGLAIVAQKYWQARKAAELVQVVWDETAHKHLQNEDIFASFEATAAAQSRKRDESSGLGEAAQPDEVVIAGDYRLPYLAHATMEPMNCTVRLSQDSCEVWAPTQSPALARDTAARILGLASSQVKIHTTFLGGGFGRRFYQDFIGQAVSIAKQVAKPIKLIWSREEDMQHDFYRPANVHKVKVLLNRQGRIRYWQHVIVGPSILSETLQDWVPTILPPWIPQFMRSFAGSSTGHILRLTEHDPTGSEGAEDTPYDWGEKQVSFDRVDPGVPVGFWRSVGHSYTGFVVETMMDELAQSGGIDPFDFRKQHLQNKSRHQRVLDELKKHSAWGATLGKGLFRGMAMHECFGTICGQVVELRIAEPTREIKVERVVCVVDCGQVIQPNIVEAQIAGSVIFALSAALRGEISIKDGQVEQSNFHDYAPLRLSECPRIEVHTVKSQASPSGVGEPGVPPLAAAMANAIFAATGQRLRRLPLKLATS